MGRQRGAGRERGRGNGKCHATAGTAASWVGGKPGGEGEKTRRGFADTEPTPENAPGEAPVASSSAIKKSRRSPDKRRGGGGGALPPPIPPSLLVYLSYNVF